MFSSFFFAGRERRVRVSIRRKKEGRKRLEGVEKKKEAADARQPNDTGLCFFFQSITDASQRRFYQESVFSLRDARERPLYYANARNTEENIEKEGCRKEKKKTQTSPSMLVSSSSNNGKGSTTTTTTNRHHPRRRARNAARSRRAAGAAARGRAAVRHDEIVSRSLESASFVY